MEKAELVSESFWSSEESHVMGNTLAAPVGNIGVGEEIIRELPSHFFFRTSGSSGKPKWVAISKAAMLYSAEAVNLHLGIEKRDIWFNALPLFHVGGMSIMARACLSGAEVRGFVGDWDPVTFVDAFGSCGATWTSLVPTQLVDIVRSELTAPEEHRGVLIGGGAIAESLLEDAVSLGWRIYRTYGMSEAGSQIATATKAGGEMSVLAHLETKIVDGKLRWRGASKFSGYVRDGVFEEHAGWVETEDRVTIENGELAFISRADRKVKVLGELVELDVLECSLNKTADQQVVIVARPETRRGHKLVAVMEDEPSEELKAKIFSLKGVEKISGYEVISFPRSPLGKVMRGDL